ncbi:diguanylate cyclase [Saccharophagus sp. K07]|uniref:sensor domain-containing diguanylate cyclase n=1 Tax=Saccharophagus sp. K07 TaxID=2283636 RepID=UPI00165298E2|nr:diguanylate cyclase [Saccharophagus sp. K07]MBC6906378.1 diguanylate cyclase [Saccharophagus sp. K07]
MTPTTPDFANELHWVMDILHNIDVGLVVVDLNMHIRLWNGFMQNHSAKAPEAVLNQNIFDIFPELPETWFRRKIETVAVLQTAAFTTWEQRPYLFHFKNYRPVTGSAKFMYQNCTMLPLTNAQGEVNHVCVIIYDVTEVAIHREQLQQANEQLQHINRTDGLTGLLNRKAWEQSLRQEFKRYQRYHRASSLIMLDIDHFKDINDTYGHPAGDEVIRRTAAALVSSLRDSDVAGRYGGEEFAVILVDTDATGAEIVAERLRTSVEASSVAYEEHVINYTISLGIAELTPKITDPTMWIDTADRGLYNAKRAGRNRSSIYYT